MDEDELISMCGGFEDHLSVTRHGNRGMLRWLTSLLQSVLNVIQIKISVWMRVPPIMPPHNPCNTRSFFRGVWFTNKCSPYNHFQLTLEPTTTAVSQLNMEWTGWYRKPVQKGDMFRIKSTVPWFQSQTWIRGAHRGVTRWSSSIQCWCRQPLLATHSQRQHLHQSSEQKFSMNWWEEQQVTEGSRITCWLKDMINSLN